MDVIYSEGKLIMEVGGRRRAKFSFLELDNGKERRENGDNFSVL